MIDIVKKKGSLRKIHKRKFVKIEGKKMKKDSSR